MRIMLDNGIVSHSEFAESFIEDVPIKWGPTPGVSKIHRLRRKRLKDDAYEKQKEALFTIGRLIREKRLIAYTYHELNIERIRGRSTIQQFNALQGCEVHTCDPAVERSRMISNAEFKDYISKGKTGAGAEPVDASQVAFCMKLCDLTKEEVDVLISSAPKGWFTPFEIESFKDIDWFQALCKRWRSPNNYPDVFHLWTTRRNGIGAFLTLENKLPNFLIGLEGQKGGSNAINLQVLRPLELLQKLGITEPDPVPIEAGRSYNMF